MKTFLSFLTLVFALFIAGNTLAADTIAKINFCHRDGEYDQEGWASVYGTESTWPIDLGNEMTLVKVDGSLPHLGDFHIDDIGAEIDGFPANVQNSGNYLANVSEPYTIGFKITGLDPDEEYTFDVYSRGWGADGEKISKFSVVEGDTLSINSVLNEEVLTFTDLQPNSAGELTLSLTKVGDGYAYINGLIITKQEASTPLPTGTNVALNKPAGATSIENSFTEAQYAFDGDMNTRWASAETDTDFETICVDLQGKYELSAVVLTWEAAYGMAYTIDVSDDSTNWTTLFTTTEGDGETDIIYLSGIGRYVRLDATDRGTPWAYSIYEFEVYGTLIAGLDQENVALNKPAGATSIENSFTEAQYAFDGDPSTRWASAETDTDFETICVDLQGKYELSAVVLTWEAAYGMSYTIDVSDDSTNWTTLFTTTEGDGETDIIQLSGIGRYVRLDATDRGTPWAYSIYEFEVYGTLIAGLDQENVALNKPAGATSIENSFTEAQYAFDGDPSTRWASAETDTDFETICVDLQGKYELSAVILTWEAAYGMAYTIDVSDDSTNWTTLFTTTEGDGGTDIIQLSGTGRYVRLDATDRGTPWAYSIYEFEVYGTLIIEPTNVSLNKPAGATSIEGTGFEAQYAFDGDLFTRWASAEVDTDFETICVDLQGTYLISSVVLTWEAAYGLAYTIDVSNDSINWTTLYSTTTGDGGTDEITLSGVGRYVRLDATDRGTVYAYSIFEFEVYGIETIADKTIYVDFGAEGNTTDGWNNLTDASDQTAVALVDGDGNNTGISIAIHDVFSGVNETGTTTPDASLGIPASSTSDSFFGSAVEFDGKTEPTGGVTLSGLSTGYKYTLSMFGSRNATDNRETEFKVTGDTEETVYLNVAGNTSEFAIVEGIKPAADGTITIDVAPGANNDNSFKFYYFGALKITSEPIPVDDAIYVDFGAEGNTTEGWNNLTDASDQTAVELIDGNGENTGISIAIHDVFNDINESGTTTPDASLGIPASATSDSFFGSETEFDGKTEPTGGVTLSGLEVNRKYTLSMFGSRNADDNRETEFKVTGNTEETVYLNAAGNTSDFAIVTDMQPASDGTITIDVAPGPNNNNSYKFYYFGALKIEAGGYNAVKRFDQANDVSCYPVPCSSQLTITNVPHASMVAIYSIAGKRMIEQVNSGSLSDMKVNVENLQSGIYLVRITHANEIIKSIKLIKK